MDQFILLDFINDEIRNLDEEIYRVYNETGSTSHNLRVKREDLFKEANSIRNEYRTNNIH